MSRRGRPPGSGRTEPTERELAMAAAYRAGKTLTEIGAEHGGLSRQRIEQILKRRFGIRAKDGGEQLRAKRRRNERAVVKDEKALKRWGCTWAQYVMLRSMLKPTRAYSMQRTNADRRGIAWELNLWQWWTIWQESGRWNQRGRGNGYMMCRNGVVGPYSANNVFIERGIFNSSDAQKKKSGLPLGVGFSKTLNKFLAHRCVGGKQRRLGTFDTPDLAHAAYLAADPFLSVAA